jgi:hypothetical protein
MRSDSARTTGTQHRFDSGRPRVAVRPLSGTKNIQRVIEVPLDSLDVWDGNWLQAVQ